VFITKGPLRDRDVGGFNVSVAWGGHFVAGKGGEGTIDLEARALGSGFGLNEAGDGAMVHGGSVQPLALLPKFNAPPPRPKPKIRLRALWYS